MAAFYFDRGLYLWANFVDNKVAEAEAKVRNAFKNRKGSEPFINSEKTKAFNRLLGINDPTAGYRVYSLPKIKPKEVTPQQESISGEGEVDLSVFNPKT